MLPSVELRIRNVIKALSEVVLPAIDPKNALAREQAQLAIGHLQLIAQQWSKAPAFDALALEALRALGERLAAAAEGGGETVPAAAALREALSLDSDPVALGRAIDRLIRAASADGAAAFRAELDRAVREHGGLQAWRERVWFAGTGLDPDARALPSIDDMLRGARPSRS